MHNKKILFVVVLGVIVYASLVFFADYGGLVQAFRHFRWGWFWAALSLAMLNYIVRFHRWEYYLAKSSIFVKRGESLAIFLMGLIMSITPGKAGEILKSALLKETNGTSISKSAPIIFMERFTDFLAVLLLAATGVMIFKFDTSFLIIPVIIVLSLFFLLSMKDTVYKLLFLMKKANLLKSSLEWLESVYQHTARMLTFRSLSWATTLSIMAWFAECAGLYVVLRGFEVEVSLMYSTFVYALATLMGAVSMIPGGIGTTEGGMVFLLVMGGVPKDTAVAATVIIRACTLWFAVLLGITVMLLRPAFNLGSTQE